MPGHPAGTTPPPTAPAPATPTATAEIIDISGRTRRPGPGEATVNPHAAPTPPSAGTDPRLAGIVQALYTARGYTLTDPVVADAYDIALEAMVLLLDGSYRTGSLGESEHHRLRAMVDTARMVPDYLETRHA
ncbi:hypothetical protein [Streptomyces sp. NPDC017529]|uniref:hypothetical protein n=1 Tax=Streptomyces sp. NPDC017529 TaxID=3365000 RepID=UPI0037896973